MTKTLEARLAAFAAEAGFRGKGPLCVALVVTEHARERGLPLSADDLLTDGGGQVLGLGKGRVQGVLARHGVSRVLASEGGRTSRGSLGNMRAYVDFLGRLAAEGEVDVARVEAFWIGRVRDFFAAKPFRARLDASKGVRAAVSDVIAQARDREAEAHDGTSYAGAVLQHLVGAALELGLGDGVCIDHHGASTADAPGGRAGDFLIGDTAIHVTTAPGEAVVARCQENFDTGLRPVIVTLDGSQAAIAEELARRARVLDRLDVFGVAQFAALNVLQGGRFEAAGRREAFARLVDAYNRVVDEVETDPSLRIEFVEH